MSHLIDQPTAAPTEKVAAAAVGGAAATIVVVTIQLLTGVEFPVGFEAAVAVIFGVIAGYMKREKA